MASVKEVLEAHLCPEEQPVALLECAQAFDKLTDKEKLYLHHLNEGSSSLFLSLALALSFGF